MKNNIALEEITKIYMNKSYDFLENVADNVIVFNEIINGKNYSGEVHAKKVSKGELAIRVELDFIFCKANYFVVNNNGKIRNIKDCELF